jgi:hypothetical protein
LDDFSCFVVCSTMKAANLFISLGVFFLFKFLGMIIYLNLERRETQSTHTLPFGNSWNEILISSVNNPQILYPLST